MTPEAQQPPAEWTHAPLTCPKCSNVCNHHRDLFGKPTYCDKCRTHQVFKWDARKAWEGSK